MVVESHPERLAAIGKKQSSQIAITRAAHQSGREVVRWSNGVLRQRMGVNKVLCTQGLVQ